MQSNAKAVCELVKNQIKSEMNGKMLSLKIDLTHHMNRCIFGINVQYYVEDRLVVRTLAMKRYLDETTGIKLAFELKRIMEDYEFDIRRIYTITTDNGTNVMKCTKVMQALQGNELADYMDIEIGMLDENIVLRMVETELQSTARGEDLNFLFHVCCSTHTMQLSLSDIFAKKRR